MNTCALRSAANGGVWLQEAVPDLYVAATSAPASPESRRKHCLHRRTCSFTVYNALEWDLQNGQSSSPGGQRFPLPVSNVSRTGVLWRSAENFAGPWPAPRVLPSNVFVRRCWTSMRLPTGRRKLTAVLAHRNRRTRTGMGQRIAAHSLRPLEPKNRRTEIGSRGNTKVISLDALLYFGYNDAAGRSARYRSWLASLQETSVESNRRRG